MKSLLPCAVAAATLLAAGGAAASPCAGDVLPAGSTFRGPVLHVLDGSTLCVALSPSPDGWAELRLADAPPHATRSLLMAVAFAQDVDCTVIETRADAALAVCSLRGRRLGELARDPKARKRARAWR